MTRWTMAMIYRLYWSQDGLKREMILHCYFYIIIYIVWICMFTENV